MGNKKIIIEDLAGMIKKGFDGVDERFDAVDQKLDKHAVILVDHSKKLQRIELKLENVVYHGEFDELKGRVDALENLLAVKNR